MHILVLISALVACAEGVPLNTTKPRPDGRIIGGTVTDITNHPYQVSLHYIDSHLCGGSIISPTWMVTTARCVSVFLTDRLFVRSGSTYSNTGGSIHNITRIIRHESFGLNLEYDVALVQVSPAFTFSDSVQPITLECNPVPVGTDVVVTGYWGDPSDEGDYRDALHQVTLQITSDSECKSYYEGITDRVICAGDPNRVKAADTGDRGGPLVASSRLVGIYSVGYEGLVPTYPGLFTKVSAVCDWIIINAGLFKISAFINWIETIPGLQTMPLTFIATYSNN